MFIDIEGIDRFSRATLADAVTSRLSRLGYRVARAEQPRGEDLAAERTAQARFFLEAAKSSQLLESFIRPTLARGEVAVTNGYVFGPLAEACAAGADRYESLEATAQIAAQGMWPDLVVLLDTSTSIAAVREGLDRARSDAAFVRESLLELARRDPHRWVVVDCDFVRPDSLAEQVAELVLQRLTGAEGQARPKPSAGVSGLAAEDVGTRLFEAVDALEESDGARALIALTGVGGPAAHQRRLRWVSTAPRLVARSLRGATDDESWVLRELLTPSAPREVLESVAEDRSARALRCRAQLIDAQPAAAVKGLCGDSPQAWWLREQALRAGEVDAVLESLGGLDHPRAWSVRARYGGAASARSLLLGIRGLACPRAEAIRDRHVATLPLEVLASIHGVDTRHAHDLRTQLFSRAPGAVTASLCFVDSAHAWELREKAAPRHSEPLGSIIAMSCEAAWSLRERYATRWPAEAISSLSSLASTPRGAAVIARALRGTNELFALKAAYLASQQPRPSTQAPKAVAPTLASPAPV